MNDKRNDAERRDRIVKFAFGVGALSCVLSGLALYVFAENLGFDPETAQIVAIAFLVAGFADYLVLRFWDRIIAKRRR